MLASASAPYRFCFSTDTAPTEIYTLSLHDALPILPLADPGVDEGVGVVGGIEGVAGAVGDRGEAVLHRQRVGPDRKSTRLNSSHPSISYAVFCLKKKKQTSVIRPIYHQSALHSSAQ